MKKPTEGKGIKICDWCGELLGEVYFIDKKTKKKFHMALTGNDCLQEFIDSNKK
jgi:hypothetical protein